MTTVADAKATLAALETKLADTRQWQIESAPQAHTRRRFL